MKLLLYGNLAEAIGREVELDVAPGATVATARRALATRFPDAAAMLARGVCGCIGDVIVGDEEIVPEGAALAFFPPLSGG